MATCEVTVQQGPKAWMGDTTSPSTETTAKPWAGGGQWLQPSDGDGHFDCGNTKPRKGASEEKPLSPLALTLLLQSRRPYLGHSLAPRLLPQSRAEEMVYKDVDVKSPSRCHVNAVRVHVHVCVCVCVCVKETMRMEPSSHHSLGGAP